jgi:hypothetical protein
MSQGDFENLLDVLIDLIRWQKDVANPEQEMASRYMH